MSEQTNPVLMAQAYETWRADGDFGRVYELFPTMPKASVRRKVYGYHEALNEGRIEVPQPVIEGDLADEMDEIDEEEVWQRAIKESQRAQKRHTRPRRISFGHGAICLVFLADPHLGSDGTDYARLDDEIDLILDTPGAYVGLVGDMIDNFIIGRLVQQRINNTPFRITDEWVLVKRVLKKLAPRLIFSVAGNHDNWTQSLTGIDYLREIHQQLNPNIIYHNHDLQCEVVVGGYTWRLRARHKWQGFSIYNATHGTERASKFDKEWDFDIGVAAHTHASGLAREFNNGGRTGLAILCGSYKRIDSYAVAQGFARPNQATAVAVIMDDQGHMLGTSDLEMACKYMKAVYGGEE